LFSPFRRLRFWPQTIGSKVTKFGKFIVKPA
jgi:hypothetical protein